ncbi:pyridoxamine 5'-phosphate oxidase family protein [Ktedonobacter robiniae]|uniref:Pyridoxamine 5'-phosphate oxidase putative domain-containing protein n=1 Tax=Ktedonobacter robiniae TaxID=2778365 RepID=A0ABQ3UWZ7_9CHLR|nr:pyridoxamine 5'-phosphate oxidase family protein [Ktedonobacter robiniae]GHO56915.1 hypothetical protein KSB_53900 [Ktedonobacter robiniae]
MRKNLHVADLDDLLEQPLNGVLATYRSQGEVLLSPVWYEWLDGGFNVVVQAHDAKHRNLQSDPERVSSLPRMEVATAELKCGVLRMSQVMV